MSGPHFVLVSQTTLIEPKDLYDIRDELEVNWRHCADVWGLEAPTVDVFNDDRDLKPDTAVMLFVSDDSHPDAGAFHKWDYVRGLPASRVYVQRSTGRDTGPASVREFAGHELCEALVDPYCDLYTDLPGRPGVQVAYEVGDPVQDTYEHDGAQLANFVYPSYFDSRLADPERCNAFLDAGGRFDHKGTLRAPGTIGPEGYLILRDNDRTWTEDITGVMPALKKPGAMHPLARTRRRLGLAA